MDRHEHCLNQRQLPKKIVVRQICLAKMAKKFSKNFTFLFGLNGKTFALSSCDVLSGLQCGPSAWSLLTNDSGCCVICSTPHSFAIEVFLVILLKI
jgi:hypothetical protein